MHGLLGCSHSLCNSGSTCTALVRSLHLDLHYISEPKRAQLHGHRSPRRPHQRHAPSQRRHACTPVAKMHVPSDSFGGQSPERRAARALQNLFTFIAVKVVLAQLEGSGRGSLASYNPRSYEDLTAFIEQHPLTDGDEWLRLLLRHNEMLAVRIMEVRKTYCEEDFEWDQTQRLALKTTAEANAQLMQQHASESFTKRMLADSAQGTEEQDRLT